jgi:threonyl-tRNA synthetase
MNNEMEKIRHSLSHLLAMAVLKEFPKTKLGMGPSIENGFYYDFEFSDSFEEKDLKELEKIMRKMIQKKIFFRKKNLSFEEGIKLFKELKQPFKLELIKEIKKDKKNKNISIYYSDDFVDLCSGPHVQSTEEINSKAFKLTRIAGAYWKGNEKNKMLTRIYGIAFKTEKELKEYEELLEEAKKRDHRKLGKELDLFVFSDLVGSGLPLYTPKGVVVIEELKKHIEGINRKYGFQKVMTPHLAKIELYKISGHADKFKEELFHVSSQSGHKFVMKPVQCPHQTQIFSSKPRSYKELPIRYMESEKQYRAEKSGEVGGLNRVYAITVEDGHSFCTIEQAKQEIINMVNVVKKFYNPLGLWENTKVYLSVRDKKTPEKYIGDEKDWNFCEKILKEVSDEMNLNAKREEGEAALYGPKLDFKFKDALGKEIQIPTIQIDFATPKRFNLKYIDKEGKEKPPVMIHRAILGSYERFLALLLEHFAGALPFWLSPIQIQILPVSEKHKKFAIKLKNELEEENFRIEIDDDNETIGKKIRQAEMNKIPYIIVVGDKEMKSKKLAIRERGKKKISEMEKEKFIQKIKKLVPKI